MRKTVTFPPLRRLLITASVVAICTTAAAQQDAPALPAIGSTTAVPYATLAPANDSAALRTALNAAKSGDVSGGRAAIASISDPLTRKVALWALADTCADSLSFSELDEARRGLTGWPREARRINAAEKQVAASGMSPQRIVDWFAVQPPRTAEGTMALAQALSDSGQTAKASDLIRTAWRTQVFEADAQGRMLARFGQWLTPADHARRADVLLYASAGPGPAARDMLKLLSDDDLAKANARIALRAGGKGAETAWAALTPEQQTSPGVAFERASYLRKANRVDEALALAAYFQPAPSDDVGGRVWVERRALIAQALRAGNSATAYALAANSGLTSGADAAEAEFYAGWLALTRLKNSSRAETHFAKLAGIGQSPLTRSRALYWQGRAAMADGDPVAAAGFYGEGARYQTTFYGQLAAEKAGIKTIALGSDPAITPADRARFEGYEIIRAARLLYSAGATDAFRAFVLAADDLMPTAQDEAMLVDMALNAGDQDLAMRAARAAATRGFILPERGYPLVPPPGVQSSAETAFSLSIARQESNFDPNARSGVGARGMMQLMPETAKLVARKMGETYAPAKLTDASYNMRLGSTYLGDMVDNFSGSYVMAAAAYNAGPGRPRDWVNFCGDPRSGANDPVDFIECIPFSETRNYVMRTLESTLVYRARLNGGSTPLTISSDLRRGAYVYSPVAPVVANSIASVAATPSAELASSDAAVRR